MMEELNYIFFKINLMILIAQEIKHVHVTGD